MYYDSKYLTVISGYPSIEYPPTIYLEYFYLKSDLRRKYRDNSLMSFEFGFFSKYIRIEFRWGFVEREMTEIEKERDDYIKEFMKIFDSTK